MKCLLDNVDGRTRDLLLWGSWSDGRKTPCESCGTDIVIMESTRRTGDLTDTWKRWVEVVSGHITEDGICSVVITEHGPERCKELRRTS